MHFITAAVALLVGAVAAGDVTVTVTSSVTVSVCPVTSVAAPVSVSSCDMLTDTCTKTVTKPWSSWGTGAPWPAPSNITAPVAVGTG